jgi:hypothetical protein
LRTLDFMHGHFRVAVHHSVTIYGRDGQPVAACTEVTPHELRIVGAALQHAAGMLEAKAKKRPEKPQMTESGQRAGLLAA